jgi:CRP-like cAMP-binding protein
MDTTGPSRASGPNRLLALPRAELERLRPHLEMVPLVRRRFVLPAGEPLPYVYFPFAGVVSLLIGMADGSTVEVATVGREGMLGVSVLLEADPPPYDMVCQISGEAARLASPTFVQLVDELPSFRRRVKRYTLGLLNEVARTAACNRLHSVEQRLARWLLLSRDRVGADVFPITHESLAHMLGARRPFVTRTASRLQQAGLIRYGRGAVRILDADALEAVACEDYQVTRREYARLLD